MTPAEAARRVHDSAEERLLPGNDHRWARWGRPLAQQLAEGPRSFASLIAFAASTLHMRATRAVAVLAWLENERLATSGRGVTLTITSLGVRFLDEHRAVGLCPCFLCSRMAGDRA